VSILYIPPHREQIQLYYKDQIANNTWGVY